MKKIIKGLIGGTLFGILNGLFGSIIYGFLFAKWSKESASLWRAMDSILWRVGMPLASIFCGLLYALSFVLLYKGIPGTGLNKGINFGLILWIITRLGGEISMYTMSPFPFMLVIAGWIHGLLTCVLGGMIISAVYGKTIDNY